MSGYVFNAWETAVEAITNRHEEGYLNDNVVADVIAMWCGRALGAYYAVQHRESL
jgi:hypothetical protein